MKTILKSALLVLQVCYLSSAISQVHGGGDTNLIFHDYEPDVVLVSMDTLLFDFDEDGNIDMLFRVQEGSAGDWTIIESLSSNCYFSLLAEQNIDTLNADQIYWRDERFTYLYTQHTTDRFGVKILDEQDAYYGWIHAVFGFEQIVVDKYVFCNIPNYPLLYGQTEMNTIIESVKQDLGIVVSYNFRDMILNIAAIEQMENIRLYNATGYSCFQKSLVNSNKMNLSIAGYKSGIYFLVVKTIHGKLYRKKIIVP